ncbi:MAG: proline dehydrogenase family protein [Geodermatophilaceae bacterium]
MSVVRASLFRLATSTRLERAVRATAQGERLARRAADRYVAGLSVADAWQVAAGLHQRGVGASVDQFGELVADAATADRVADDYQQLAAALPDQPEGVWLSVDLSHLGLDIAPRRCAEHLTGIAAAVPAGRRIQVGAEDYHRADAVLGCVLAAAETGLADRLGATVQANLHRSAADLDRLVGAGVHIRLVKGAYVEPHSRALPYGEPTDIAYVRLAHRLAAAGGECALATHDGVVREALLTALGPVAVEQLLGVRPEVLDDLVTRRVPVRVYVPFGGDWFRYWMRRVAESRGTA